MTTINPPSRVDARGDRTSRGILAYLALAFGLAWLPFLAAPAGPGSRVALLMPVVVAFVVRRWITREGFADAGLRPDVRRWPLYLLALAWTFAVHPLRVALSPALVGVVPDGFSFPWGLATPGPRDVLAWALLPLAAAPVFLGEEFGWRGYLQARLLVGRPLAAALATGALWGVWHYPLILAGGAATDDRLLTLLLYPLATTVSSVFLGWLRLRSGSVWAPSVAHAANNLAADPLSRLGFAGRADGVLPLAAAAPSLLAEALVFGAVVAGDRLWHRKRAPLPAAAGFGAHGGNARTFGGGTET